MTPSFEIHFEDINPEVQAVARLPKDISCRIPFATHRTWADKENWYSIQCHNAKHVYLYSIEIETKRRLEIPVSIHHPDTHCQFSMKGGYSLAQKYGAIPILQEGQKHLIQGEKNNFTIEVDKGRHWIIGFNVAASWLSRYPEDIFFDSSYLIRELERDMLYQSIPRAMSELDRAQLHYLMELAPSKHMVQDCQIYVPVSKLVDQMHIEANIELSPIEAKVQAVQYYIQQLISTDKVVPTIKTIASKFYIDKNYLGKMFREITDESLGHYIFRAKQERAVVLLIRKVPISEIAHLLGYNDNSAFRKAFKKYYGVCPSEYLDTNTKADQLND